MNDFENISQKVINEEYEQHLFITNRFSLEKRYYLNVRKFGGSTNKLIQNALIYFQNICENIKSIDILNKKQPGIFFGYSSEIKLEIYKQDLNKKIGINRWLMASASMVTLSNPVQSTDAQNTLQKLKSSQIDLDDENSVLSNLENQATNSPGKQIPTKDPMISGNDTYTIDGEVFVNKWQSFIDSVKSIVTEKNQTGYGVSGVTMNELVTKEREISARDKPYYGLAHRRTFSRSLLQQALINIHNNVMIPWFLASKEKPLLYLTHEQWDSISKSGRLLKGVQALGSLGKNIFQQIMSAGANQPNVKL